MASDPQQPKEVRLHSLAAAGDGQGCILLLEEVGGSRLLPIVTGPAEGQALVLKAAGTRLPRPMTYDLLVSLIAATGFKFERVVVSEIRDGTFYARIHLRKGDETLSVDSRPSDAVNVALRAECPIFVSEGVFADGGPVLKPISGDEIARFKSDLGGELTSKTFEDLGGAPAPKELP